MTPSAGSGLAGADAASSVPVLRTVVQSFDMFDTLIARRCVTPVALFDEVGAAFGRRDFAAARIAAERRSAEAGPFDLETIYRTLHGIGYCDATTARRLLGAEIDAEFDNAIPIARNLAAVRDFDLVVSDMYLPAHILRDLLRHVGLRHPVHLLVSNAGKHSGVIWPSLAQRWLIQRHLGDNEHADIAVPRGFGIPCAHYPDAAMTDAETFLDDSGLPGLARLTRELRLANPFAAGCMEEAAWNHFVGLNVPLLALTAAELVMRRRAGGYLKLLLVERDCHFLGEVLRTLFAGEPAEPLYVSRALLGADGVAQYLEAAGIRGALVCDLVSTGLSWLGAVQATGLSVDMFALVHVDNYQYQEFDRTELERTPGLRFDWGLPASRVGSFSKAIEAMNTAPHGAVVAVTLGAAGFEPRFAEGHELPGPMLDVLLAAQGAAVAALRRNRRVIAAEADALAGRIEVLETLVRSLCAPAWLNELACNV